MSGFVHGRATGIFGERPTQRVLLPFMHILCVRLWFPWWLHFLCALVDTSTVAPTNL